jgi:hypothetical protein
VKGKLQNVITLDYTESKIWSEIFHANYSILSHLRNIKYLYFKYIPSNLHFITFIDYQPLLAFISLAYHKH